MQNTRRTFWLIWIVALFPVIAAVLMYFSGALTPERTINRGELLTDQTLSQWQLTDQGEPWIQVKQWKVLQTKQDQCQGKNNCQRWQQALPKVVARLGKDSDRVSIFAVSAAQDELSSPKLEALGDAIWLVDPLGNIVLRYPLSMQPEDLLKDLKKLLKLSGIG